MAKESRDPVTQETCWTLVKAAAAGDPERRAEFARYYLPIVRASLAARWRRSPLRRELDDAIQDVFVECFRAGGAIERADRTRGGGFRAYLLGTVQNIAARIETRQARMLRSRVDEGSLSEEPRTKETRLSQAFDREWARSLMRRAGALQTSRAKAAGDAAERRVRILHLRFEENLPTREIAARLGIKASIIQHEYARARREFRDALLEVVAFHHPGSRRTIDLECAKLLSLLE